MQDNTIPEYLTPRDIADRLRVDVSTVRRWIKRGVVPSIALPNAYGATHIHHRVHRSVFEKMIQPVIAN